MNSLFDMLEVSPIEPKKKKKAPIVKQKEEPKSKVVKEKPIKQTQVPAMSFEEEMADLKDKNNIEDMSAYKIGLYLQRRANEEPSIARNIRKKGKSLRKCYRYVKSEVGKLVKREPVVMMTDDPIYNMAVHYYDEDDI